MDTGILAKYGIDYQQGLERCMGDEEFYERFLAMFLNDDAFERAALAYEKRDLEALFQCLHELKGVCGNAAMTELYEAVCPIVEMLRHGCTDMAQISPAFEKVRAAHTRAREGVFIATQSV